MPDKSSLRPPSGVSILQSITAKKCRPFLYSAGAFGVSARDSGINGLLTWLLTAHKSPSHTFMLLAQLGKWSCDCELVADSALFLIQIGDSFAYCRLSRTVSVTSQRIVAERLFFGVRILHHPSRSCVHTPNMRWMSSCEARQHYALTNVERCRGGFTLSHSLHSTALLLHSSGLPYILAWAIRKAFCSGFRLSSPFVWLHIWSTERERERAWNWWLADFSTTALQPNLKPDV